MAVVKNSRRKTSGNHQDFLGEDNKRYDIYRKSDAYTETDLQRKATEENTSVYKFNKWIGQYNGVTGSKGKKSRLQRQMSQRHEWQEEHGWHFTDRAPRSKEMI